MARALRSTCLCILGVLSVGPLEEGTDVTLQGGGGRYQYQHNGCAGSGGYDPTVYGANAGHGYVAVGHRDGHFSVSFEGTGEPGLVNRSTCPGCIYGPPPAYDLGRRSLRLAGNVRIGGQWDHVGFEIGPGFGGWPTGGASPGQPIFELVPYPSATFWAGEPRLIYFWGSFGAGPRFPGPFMGLGRKSDRFEAHAGVGSLLTPPNDPRLGFLLTLDVKPYPRLWPGVDLRYQDADNWSAGLRLTFHVAGP